MKLKNQYYLLFVNSYIYIANEQNIQYFVQQSHPPQDFEKNLYISRKTKLTSKNKSQNQQNKGYNQRLQLPTSYCKYNKLKILGQLLQRVLVILNQLIAIESHPNNSLQNTLQHLQYLMLFATNQILEKKITKRTNILITQSSQGLQNTVHQIVCNIQFWSVIRQNPHIFFWLSYNTTQVRAILPTI
eukprot:TRINITY_DN8906_c0_g1_i1.p2 TRINITY_DN8906_c0_g1~~TRINITY_DN8906_c0_g1_i1.p2  ORF type:complete len:187 (+),score=-16.09 TRINITY_DN8906_c0_g1_i1:1540-2100(+)